MSVDDLNNAQPDHPEDSGERHPAADSEDEMLIVGESLPVPQDEDAIPLEIEEDEPDDEDTPTRPAPSSALPPRIVAEAPLGGAARSRPTARSTPPETKEVQPQEEPSADADRPAEPASESPADAAEIAAAPPAIEEHTPEQAPPAEGQPPTPSQPPSRVTMSESAPVPSREDWQDDDLSPELAAVLFGERKPKAAAPAETKSPAAASSPESQPAATPTETEPPAEPIALTDITAARRLRLTAKGHSAAAPDAALQGKTRYVRVEEPLSGDRGQRTVETWTYFEPDYPSLDGRLVRRVRIEEITYADGSWEWHYERGYSDRGKDRREVRASADHAYVERDDTVSKLAPQTGKRVKVHEDAALILAAPEREEKHGLLSGLLGRDDDDDHDAGSRKSWREASASERRQARKQGGQAFPRRFLGIF